MSTRANMESKGSPAATTRTDGPEATLSAAEARTNGVAAKTLKLSRDSYKAYLETSATYTNTQRKYRNLTAGFTGLFRGVYRVVIGKKRRANLLIANHKATAQHNAAQAVSDLLALLKLDSTSTAGGIFRESPAEAAVSAENPKMTPNLIAYRIKTIIGENPELFLNLPEAEQNQLLTLFTPLLAAMMSVDDQAETLNTGMQKDNAPLSPAHVGRFLQNLSASCGGAKCSRMKTMQQNSPQFYATMLKNNPKVMAEEMKPRATIATAIGGTYDANGVLVFPEGRLEAISRVLQAAHQTPLTQEIANLQAKLDILDRQVFINPNPELQSKRDNLKQFIRKLTVQAEERAQAATGIVAQKACMADARAAVTTVEERIQSVNDIMAAIDSHKRALASVKLDEDITHAETRNDAGLTIESIRDSMQQITRLQKELKETYSKLVQQATDEHSKTYLTCVRATDCEAKKTLLEKEALLERVAALTPKVSKYTPIKRPSQQLTGDQHLLKVERDLAEAAEALLTHDPISVEDHIDILNQLMNLIDYISDASLLRNLKVCLKKHWDTLRMNAGLSQDGLAINYMKENAMAIQTCTAPVVAAAVVEVPTPQELEIKRVLSIDPTTVTERIDTLNQLMNLINHTSDASLLIALKECLAKHWQKLCITAQQVTDRDFWWNNEAIGYVRDQGNKVESFLQ